jgi:hypothetical protein
MLGAAMSPQFPAGYFGDIISSFGDMFGISGDITVRWF